MQARRSISLLVASIATALPGVGAYADDAPQATVSAPAVQAAAPGSGDVPIAQESVMTSVAPATSTTSTTSAATDTLAGVTPPAAAPSGDDSFGVAMTPDQLDGQRGGDALIGQNYLTGDVANNTASRVQTGSNSISEGSFASSSGLPTVIQNTGANVLIQNATVLNVRFGN